MFVRLQSLTVWLAFAGMLPQERTEYLEGYLSVEYSTPTNPHWPLFIDFSLALLLDPRLAFKNAANGGT